MSHQAKVVDVQAVADGILAVRARCCGNRSTDSVLSVYQLERADEEIDQDVQAHLARVEKLHADRDRAQAHLARLLESLEK